MHKLCLHPLKVLPTASLLPADFIKHCFIVFNEKAAELDNELCRLALFLNPGAKDVAVPAGNIDSLLGKVCILTYCRACLPLYVCISTYRNEH